MPKGLKIGLLAMSVVVVLGVLVGMNTHAVRAAGQQQDGAYKQINVYSEVLEHIRNEYVETPDVNSVTDGALRGLLESLDAESSYLTPADYKAYKADKAGKAQVGISISKRFGYAYVVSVIPGSPADRANLSDGDILESIEGKDTRDLSLAVIQMLLAGAPGSELTVGVIRPRKAEPEKVVLNRVVIAEPALADAQYENSTIVYLKPYALDKEHVQAIEAKLKAMPKSGKKILLDLRDVNTGTMTDAVRTANLFLATGTIATLEGQKFPKQVFTAEASKAVNTTAPMVLLVNRGTGGPGELLAAALKDNKRAEVVGEKTFGTGAVQKTFELPDGAAVILSIAKYAAPDGKKFEDVAVTPTTEVAVEQDVPDDAGDGKEPQHPVKASPKTDEPLNKALEILKAKTA